MFTKSTLYNTMSITVLYCYWNYSNNSRRFLTDRRVLDQKSSTGHGDRIELDDQTANCFELSFGNLVEKLILITRQHAVPPNWWIALFLFFYFFLAYLIFTTELIITMATCSGVWRSSKFTRSLLKHPRVMDNTERPKLL